jgi:AcrR family transcriptional regulator
VAKKTAKKINRRSEILQAAQKLMVEKGLTGVTTRQISREVGCSEGALYVHFKGRVELLLAMLEESLPDMLEPFRAVEEAVGRNTPQANLEMAVTGIYKFQTRLAPLFAGLFAEPKLLLAFRRSLSSQNKGPHLSIGAVASYIEAEQKIGRISSQLDAKVSGQLLVASAFFRAFVEHFFDKPMQPPWSNFAKELVAIVLAKQ